MNEQKKYYFFPLREFFSDLNKFLIVFLSESLTKKMKIRSFLYSLMIIRLHK